eukprot:TRINITY_DN26677_c0_g1_i1.p2 TRINITY_DN26677_c0_g1~~TRINITY_DN26677_c0_g1_i1.p2  ORF type:complete len:434 (+),score=136.87 TRINITY_DN26677_c0_g1_i1:91-1302(+)
MAAKEHLKPEFLAKNPLGKVPVLETDSGSIFESNAIARYVARLRRDTELYGVSFFESGQVDSWIDFCSHELELSVTIWLYPVLGFRAFNSGMHAKSVQDVRNALTVLENHLLLRTFLVGNKVTLADIVNVATLFYPMKFLLDGDFRASFPSVTRWFMTCVNQPAFKAVLGTTTLCTDEVLADGCSVKASKIAGGAKKAGGGKAKGGDKKAGAGKAKGGDKKAAAPAPAPAAAPAPAPAKKEKPKGPFDDLPKSSMDMDHWKRTYSNSRPDYLSSMTTFWNEIFDKEGYSIWFAKYNYNNENTVGFMTSNLVGGFLQRCDGVRRYAFGTMVIANEEKPFEVEGIWLMRGQKIEPMLDANPDAEYYTWTKLDTDDAAVRAKVGAYWCAEDSLPDGRKLFDSKLFK